VVDGSDDRAHLMRTFQSKTGLVVLSVQVVHDDIGLAKSTPQAVLIVGLRWEAAGKTASCKRGQTGGQGSD
jgi:hypothetical protein